MHLNFIRFKHLLLLSLKEWFRRNNTIFWRKSSEVQF
jgi:hypothetical protein